MKRKIRFREWNGHEMNYEPMVSLISTASINERFADNDIMQFTGLLDKNGKEIFEGDLLRCKYDIGDNEGWYVDAIYEALAIGVSGFELQFRSMWYNEHDPKCQMPISQRPSFMYGSLCVDYRNKRYGHLAFEDTSAETHITRRRWKENHYSNDVEIIGNIYESPKLLTTK